MKYVVISGLYSIVSEGPEATLPALIKKKKKKKQEN